MSSRNEARIDPGLPSNTHAVVVRLVGEGGRVLELGAASGEVTAALKGRGCQVVAVEIDPVAGADLRRIADETLIADLNDPQVLAAVTGPFDVVLAADVLEHLVDPAAVLAAAAGKLNAGGSVVLAVSHAAHVDLRLRLLQGRFDRLPGVTGVHVFTYRGLLDLLESAGLVVTEIERIEVPAFGTEFAVDPSSVSAAVLDEALTVAESQTYQFVVRAVPDTGEAALRARAAEVLRRHEEGAAPAVPAPEHGESEPIRDQLTAARSFLATAEEDRDLSRLRAEQLEVELANARADLAGMQEELAITRRELLAASKEEAAHAALKLAYAEQGEVLLTRTHERNLGAQTHVVHQRELTGLKVELAAAYGELDALRGREAAAKAAAGVPDDTRQLADLVADMVAGSDRYRDELERVRSTRAYRWSARYRRVRGIFGRV